MEKIFVAIASYRDPECQWTVKDLFAAATFPDRVFVGICWQFDSARDQDCFAVPYPRPEQVRVIDVTLQETRGACWAKSRALSLIEDENYILLIDSHMRFAKGWDVEMIETLFRTGNSRAFLSTYPAGYEPPDKRRFSTPRLAPVKFFDRVMSQNSVLLEMPRPLESYLVAGGYLFGHREMFEQVPYDPHIYFIGEEITHAARYFTHGWDGYTPDKCLIHHYYSRKSSTKHWEDEKDNWTKLNKASYKRVRHLLGIERTTDVDALTAIESYGLGDARSLTEFQAVIGVNFNAQLIDRKRYESIASTEAALANPIPPVSAHEMAILGVYACRHGHILLPKRDAYIGKSLIKYGEWADGLNQLCGNLFASGDTVVEIGAGFGARTLPFARLVGGEGTVIAVEQSRRLVDLLHANIALNSFDNVRVIHARAGSLPGAVEITEPMFDSDENFGIVSHRKAKAPLKPYVLEIPLDHQNWGQINFLFVDTPGGVSEVLHGAGRLIATHRPTIVANADNAADAETATEYLRTHDYQLWKYSCPFFTLENYFRSKENIFGGLRSSCIVAVPDNRDLSAFAAIRL